MDTFVIGALAGLTAIAGVLVGILGAFVANGRREGSRQASPWPYVVAMVAAVMAIVALAAAR